SPAREPPGATRRLCLGYSTVPDASPDRRQRNPHNRCYATKLYTALKSTNTSFRPPWNPCLRNIGVTAEDGVFCLSGRAAFEFLTGGEDLVDDAPGLGLVRIHKVVAVERLF